MYRRNIKQILHDSEAIRKEAYVLLDQNFRLTYGIPRDRDKRKYISQTEYVHRAYLQKSNDYFDAVTAVYELQKI